MCLCREQTSEPVLCSHLHGHQGFINWQTFSTCTTMCPQGCAPRLLFLEPSLWAPSISSFDAVSPHLDVANARQTDPCAAGHGHSAAKHHHRASAQHRPWHLPGQRVIRTQCPHTSQPKHHARLGCTLQVSDAARLPPRCFRKRPPPVATGLLHGRPCSATPLGCR